MVTRVVGREHGELDVSHGARDGEGGILALQTERVRFRVRETDDGNEAVAMKENCGNASRGPVVPSAAEQSTLSGQVISPNPPKRKENKNSEKNRQTWLIAGDVMVRAA